MEHHLSRTSAAVSLCCLELEEVTFDSIEPRTVRHIEDLGDVQLLKHMPRIHGLVHTQVIQEQCKITSTELMRLFLQCGWRNQVPYVLLVELQSIR